MLGNITIAMILVIRMFANIFRINLDALIVPRSVYQWGHNMWDKNKAVAYLRKNALPASRGLCAKFVRQAIRAGNIVVQSTGSSKDYGPLLRKAGFVEIPSSSSLLPGDVVVIQPTIGHPHGHMAMFDGKIWISDFRQYHGFYPGQTYRTLKPSYKFYRLK